MQSTQGLSYVDAAALRKSKTSGCVLLHYVLTLHASKIYTVGIGLKVIKFLLALVLGVMSLGHASAQSLVQPSINSMSPSQGTAGTCD